MMYTKGVRKILFGSTYKDISELFKMAEKVGYKVVSHNGTIYTQTLDDEKWHQTDLEITDFEG